MAQSEAPPSKASRRERSERPAPREHPVGLASLVDAYLQWLDVRGYSPASIAKYRSALGRFVTWCEERDLTRPEEVSAAVADRYSRWLVRAKLGRHGRPLGTKSRLGQLSVVGGFFKWCVREGHCAVSPFAEVDRPRVKEGLPKQVLTHAEVEKVLDLPDIERPLGLRDRAMLEVLYSTAMRRSELANLKLYDLDPGRGLVMIRQGKGGRDRLVPIGERAMMWLNRYLVEVRPMHVRSPDDGAVFLTQFGLALGQHTITARVTALVAEAKLGKTGGAHLLRHSAATEMLKNGADVRHVQELLGHARLATTQVYTRVAITDLKKAHTKSHPGAK